MELKAEFRNPFKKDGEIRFAYILKGNQIAIEQYLRDKRDEGYPATDESGNEIPLYISKTVIPIGVSVVRNKDGKWWPDLFILEALNSMKAQFPNLSDETLLAMIAPPKAHAPEPQHNPSDDLFGS